MLQKHVASFAILGLFVVLAAGSTESDSSSSSSSTFTSSTSSQAAEASKTPEQAKQDYLEQVDRELASISTYDGSKFRDTKEGVQMEIALLGVWAILVSDADKHDLTPSEREKVSRLRSRVSALQVRELPRMRRAWVRLLNAAVWEYDMSVTSSGTSGKTLRLTGAAFASNRNIKQIQESLGEQATLLRFRRMEYRWYRGADDYQYYTLNSPPDAAVRKLSENGFEGN